MVTKEEFKKIIDVCASMPDVKEDVFKNHDNNMWWPLEIEDYKKRLLIAGLSTRISYNMINSYRKVINKLNEYSYEQIKSKTKEEIIEIIKGLGLSNTRYSYLSSMIDFIEKYNDTILEKDNDEHICIKADNSALASLPSIIFCETSCLTIDENDTLYNSLSYNADTSFSTTSFIFSGS